MRKHLLLIVYTWCISYVCLAQEKILTVGIQFKPLIPSNVITNKVETQITDNFQFDLNNKPSYSFGMVLRKGFTKNISLESGINYVKRNYTCDIIDLLTTELKSREFSIIGYEIPTLALVYIKLSQEVYMNAAFGASIDFFPSDVGTDIDDIYHLSIRRSWVVPSMLANLGWEYRTKKSGYYYFGASFHRPFVTIYKSGFRITQDFIQTESIFESKGSYLTLDLRYFFHEEVQKKKAPVKDMRYYRKLRKARAKAAAAQKG